MWRYFLHPEPCHYRRIRFLYCPSTFSTCRWDQEEAQNAGNESSPLLDNGLNADENDRYRLGPEVIMEIRQAAREALEAARLASAQSNLGPHSASQEETRYLQAASAPSMPNLQEASSGYHV